MGTRELHWHSDTTPATVAPCKQQKNTKQRNKYWQQNSNNGDELHSAGTLAGTLILARTIGNHDKQSSNHGMTCKLA